jgi:hypothetical protein
VEEAGGSKVSAEHRRRVEAGEETALKRSRNDNARLKVTRIDSMLQKQMVSVGEGQGALDKGLCELRRRGFGSMKEIGTQFLTEGVLALRLTDGVQEL